MSFSWYINAVGGSPVTDIDLEDSRNNDYTESDFEVFLENTTGTDITNVRLYMAEKPLAYTGTLGSAADRQELLEWGDATTVQDFGGIQVNMDALNSYSAAWPTEGSKGLDGDDSIAVRTDLGSFEGNAFLLHESAIGTGVVNAAGVVSGTATPTESFARFKIRVRVPASESDLGRREFRFGIVHD